MSSDEYFVREPKDIVLPKELHGLLSTFVWLPLRDFKSPSEHTFGSAIKLGWRRLFVLARTGLRCSEKRKPVSRIPPLNSLDQYWRLFEWERFVRTCLVR